MVFCNMVENKNQAFTIMVTILILIDGFLQCKNKKEKRTVIFGHNPYFNRWFSAMIIMLFVGGSAVTSQSLF